MDIQQLNKFVQEALAAYIGKKRILVIHPYTSISNQQVDTLRNYFDVQEWSNEHSIDYSAKYYFDSVVFLEIDQNFIVSCAQGLTNTNETNFFADLLLAGETILLVPNDKIAAHISSLNESVYLKMLKDYYDRLITFGCEIQPFSQLIPSITEGNNKKVDVNASFITEQMIRELSGNKLVIPTNAKLTPLASDIVREQNIIIQRK